MREKHDDGEAMSLSEFMAALAPESRARKEYLALADELVQLHAANADLKEANHGLARSLVDARSEKPRVDQGGVPTIRVARRGRIIALVGGLEIPVHVEVTDDGYLLVMVNGSVVFPGKEVADDSHE